MSDKAKAQINEKNRERTEDSLAVHTELICVEDCFSIDQVQASVTSLALEKECTQLFNKSIQTKQFIEPERSSSNKQLNVGTSALAASQRAINDYAPLGLFLRENKFVVYLKKQMLDKRDYRKLFTYLWLNLNEIPLTASFNWCNSNQICINRFKQFIEVDSILFHLSHPTCYSVNYSKQDQDEERDGFPLTRAFDRAEDLINSLITFFLRQNCLRKLVDKQTETHAITKHHPNFFLLTLKLMLTIVNSHEKPKLKPELKSSQPVNNNKFCSSDSSLNEDKIADKLQDTTIKIRIKITNQLTIKVLDQYKSNQTKWKELVKQPTNKGAFGLVNLGNTCYMNSVLQCFFNTNELTQYFFFQFNSTLIEQGVAYQYYHLVNNLLTPNKVVTPYPFHRSFGLVYDEFNNNYQNDAQDFTVKLINALNDELTSQQFTSMYADFYLNQTMTNEHSTIHKLIEEKLAKRKHANDTVINDLFFGLFHTLLICPLCKTETNVCEAFNVNYLIIPSSKKCIQLRFFHYVNGAMHCDMIDTTIFDKTKVTTLKRIVNAKYPEVGYDNINCIPLLKNKCATSTVWEYYDKGNEFVFYENSKEKVIYILEVSESDAHVEMHCFLIGMLETIKGIIQFIMGERQSKHSHKDIETAKMYLYHNCTECQVCSSKESEYCLLDDEKSIKKLYELVQGTIVLRMNITSTNQSIRANNFSKQYTTVSDITLKDCLNYFASFDELPYNCSTCREKVKIVKRMTIAFPPKIMVIQLKRFHLSTYNSFKNSSFIDFPFELDISEHLTLTKDTAKCRYELFGIVEHWGSLSYGHYTGKCLNAFWQRWIKYNDKHVSFVKENDIITRDAYLLFYRRIDETTQASDSEVNLFPLKH